MNNTHHRSFVTQNSIVFDIIRENNDILLMLEHFDIDFSAGNKTVLDICTEYNIHIEAFLSIANLYNGYFPNRNTTLPVESLNSIVIFLKNSHLFYLKDKYPELIGYIKTLKEDKNCNAKNIYLVEKFFTDYYNEVKEHLRYEDEIAFPFFLNLLNNDNSNNDFSSKTYSDHHSDIETKLEDLKNLLINDMDLGNNLSVKRRFYNSLSDLERDLMLHSIIEEILLTPSIERLETERNA